MKNFLLSVVLVLGLNAGDFIIKDSKNTVDITVEKIQTIVKSKGMGVFGIVDHKANAKQVGLEMSEAKVIIFGNPKLGTKIMQKDIKAGLDLPIKILVYSDNRETKIQYLNPKTLEKRYDLDNFPPLEIMSKALDAITSKAAM